MYKNNLIEAATVARLRAYVPYSKFSVGAALLTKSGRVFVGCNVENISYRLTMCAEQAAVAAAVAEGELDFVAVAVVADSREPIVPCGACRQVLAEFNPKMDVVISSINGSTETLPLSELLPRAAQGILESKRNA
jgi:cytidine deaminase